MDAEPGPSKVLLAGKSQFYCYPGPASVEVLLESTKNEDGSWRVLLSIANPAIQSLGCNFSGQGVAEGTQWIPVRGSTYECVKLDVLNLHIEGRYDVCVDIAPDPRWAPLHAFTVCTPYVCGDGFATLVRT